MKQHFLENYLNFRLFTAAPSGASNSPTTHKLLGLNPTMQTNTFRPRTEKERGTITQPLVQSFCSVHPFTEQLTLLFRSDSKFAPGKVRLPFADNAPLSFLFHSRNFFFSYMEYLKTINGHSENLHTDK